MPDFGLLSVIIWLPALAGALIALFAGNAAGARWAALAVSLLQWIPGVMLWRAFAPGGGIHRGRSGAGPGACVPRRGAVATVWTP